MSRNSVLTRDIDSSIIKAKTDRRWEADYVIFQGKIYDEIEEAKAEARKEARQEGYDDGRKEERAEVLAMTDYLLKQGRYEDLGHISHDESFFQAVLDEIHSNGKLSTSSEGSGAE